MKLLLFLITSAFVGFANATDYCQSRYVINQNGFISRNTTIYTLPISKDKPVHFSAGNLSIEVKLIGNVLIVNAGYLDFFKTYSRNYDDVI